jgi:hypothetical protein
VVVARAVVRGGEVWADPDDPDDTDAPAEALTALWHELGTSLHAKSGLESKNPAPTTCTQTCEG